VDNRLVSAIGNTIDNCQGIYFKRNGRILDGPWNGENWRRTQGMGMGTNHHTAARWEFIMPSESINDPNMVPPDKRSVRTDVFQTAILNAKNESLIWHDEDEITYGSGTWADLTGGSIYTKRARSHNNSNDIPLFCLENGCETRIRHDRTLCAEHDVSRCSRCMQPLIETDENICQNCIENTCQTETCDYNVETQGDSYCLICQQPICEAFNCEERSIVQTEYCESHERQICKKIGCRSLNHSQFNKCEEHLTIFDGESGLQIKLVRLEHEGPMQINGQEILINLNDQSIRSIIMSVQEESMGMQDD